MLTLFKRLFTKDMSHCDFAIYILKKILRQNEDKMKNDENSNISPCKNIIF